MIARNGSHKDLATVRRVAARCAAAARYFKAMRRAAGRRITVVAGDIKDDPAMTGWLRAYKREVRGAKVWALHNFKDATSQYTRGAARAFVRMVRGPVWLIETGGIRSRGGLQGQARSVKRNFALAARQPRDQTHLLLRVAGGPPQPLGLRILVATGKRRPAYHALRHGLRRR